MGRLVERGKMALVAPSDFRRHYHAIQRDVKG